MKLLVLGGALLVVGGGLVLAYELVAYGVSQAGGPDLTITALTRPLIKQHPWTAAAVTAFWLVGSVILTTHLWLGVP